jgi:hypothetical protein
MTEQLQYYAPTMYLYRDDYPTRKEYIAVYQDCCKHYGYKARIFGGWIFFETADLYQTWRRQK